MGRWFAAVLLVVAVAVAVGTAPNAFAEGADKGADDKSSPEITEAQKVLTGYLDQIVKKKWDAAKKYVHPKTNDLIAAQKKKNPKYQNPMDPAAWAKDDFWLKSYKIDGAEPRAAGTVQFTIKETNYRVQEKGEDSDPETNTYLLGKSGGKWVVVDKHNNNTFDDKTIKLSYKGYFDGEPKDEAPAPKEESSKDPE